MTKEILFLMCYKRNADNIMIIFIFFSFAKIWPDFWTDFPNSRDRPSLILILISCLQKDPISRVCLFVASKKSEFKCMSRSFSFAAGTFFYSVSQNNYAAHFLIYSISVNTLGFKRYPRKWRFPFWNTPSTCPVTIHG